MLSTKLMSAKDLEKHLLFEMEGITYSIDYSVVDKIMRPKIENERIKGSADISPFYPGCHVVGCWENPTTHDIALLLDLRSMLGLSKKEYDASTVICTLHYEDLSRYAVVLDGLSERLAGEEQGESKMVVEINIRDLLVKAGF